jgi:hypothetical protein
LWDSIGWFISNIGYIISLAIIIATLGPMFIYIHKRLTIPKLKFGGFFRRDSSEVATTEPKDLTRFFIKIINVNRRSEGNAELCIGLITLGNKTYRTVWEYDYAANSFGKEALLQVFYIDKNRNTINFINYQQSQQIIESKSYGECVHSSITIRLECSRGGCPKSLTENIQSIINTETYV